MFDPFNCYVHGALVCTKQYLLPANKPKTLRSIAFQYHSSFGSVLGFVCEPILVG